MGDRVKVADISSTPVREAKEANEYWERRSERKKVIRKRKMDKQLKKVSTVFLLSAGITFSLLGKSFFERITGEKYILDNFASSDDRYDKISVVDLSNGLSVTITDKDTGKTRIVPLNYAVDYTVNRARNEGITSDEEIYIILDNCYSNVVAKEEFPDVTSKEINEAKMMAYHESQLTESKGAKK